MLKKIIDKIMGSKIFWMAFSLMAACLLWLYVEHIETSVIDFEFKEVAVEYVGEDVLDSQGLIVVESERMKTISITLSGPRNKINRMKAEDIHVTVDISNIRIATTSYFNYASGGMLIEFADTDISVLRSTPASVLVTTATSKTVDVPFVGEFVGTLANPDEYVIQKEPLVFKQETITVKGPAATVDLIAYAQVELEGENVQKTIKTKCEYILRDLEGNEIPKENLILEFEQVEVTMPVTKQKEVPVELMIREGGGATMENCSIEYSPKTIIITGDPERINGISKIELGSLDLSTIDGVHTQNYPISVGEGIEILSEETSVAVTVSINGLRTEQREVLAGNIQFNAPEGFTATLKTGSLTVNLRAPADVIGSISGENIYLSADLSTLTKAGTYQVEVTSSVVLADGTKPQAGLFAAEKNKVVITLEKTS